MSEIERIAKKAKDASRIIGTLSTAVKDAALENMATALEKNIGRILEANQSDMNSARERGTNEPLLDRLMLDEGRVRGIASAVRGIVALPDPVGEVTSGQRLPNGLEVRQIRVPLGVVGVIYEARPNVTVDATALALKSGNAVILRGGSMALQSNLTLAAVVKEAAAASGIPEGAIEAIETTDRESVNELMRLDRYVDLFVPRGGPELIKVVVENATVPVLWAGAGNCHIYVHHDADFDMAEKIVINAKVQRPSVCNAAETLLVHRDLDKTLLPQLVSSLQANGVTVVGDDTVARLPGVEAATEEDWFTEFLDLKIAVKVVEDLDEAIAHINNYGTLHSEAIITSGYASGRQFVNEVDSAAVYVNASTRFTDGGELGMGAEIGISTQKLHARGPMGLTSLTSQKYIIFGSGQARA